jgi:hypothetical protein
VKCRNKLNNRGERDELKYLSTRAGVAPGKVPVGEMSEQICDNRGERDELKYLSTRAGVAPGKVPVGEMSEQIK